MLAETFYLVRSQTDGRYLVAHPRIANRDPGDAKAPPASFVLLFREHADALSYLNTHGADVANQFAVESILGNQVGNLLKRWDFTGFGMVNDPLLPTIEFLTLG
jgi:hypothetical protein